MSQTVRDIAITRMLDIRGTDRVLIPSCEPRSSMTSERLTRFSRCCSSTVDLDLALNAIPGSSILFLDNHSRSNSNGNRKRMFVLPPVDQNCDCDPTPDWYRTLKELACEDNDDEIDASCDHGPDLFNCNTCGQPDYIDHDRSVYRREGTIYGRVSWLNNGPLNREDTPFNDL